MDFKPFSHAVHARFVELSKHELFVVGDHDFQDRLYAHYLAAFPEGTNPVYLTKTEHDCSCCRNFIKNLGRVVAIVDGEIKTVWDVLDIRVDAAYHLVAQRMAALVRATPITDLFRTKEPSYGAEVTRQMLLDKSVKSWNHFHGKVAAKHLSTEPDTAKGTYRTNVQVFQRGLEELTMDAVDSVLSLIDSKALYRGEEHRSGVMTFRLAKHTYDMLPADQQAIYLWALAGNMAASRFRNTVIGTLVDDLSQGKDLESAVRAFEAKVAPENYKRTTALITPRMVEDAMGTIRELGLEPALERRMASIADVSINNVLWADRSARGLMKGGVESLLLDVATKPRANPVSRGQMINDISIHDFMAFLPTLSSMEMLVSNTHLNNFMTVTAPATDMLQDHHQLFKWDNLFAWSYDGNVADSIKEKVKKAGGNVTNAKLRVSLAWFNYDDLDLYVTTPDGDKICFYNKRGVLDVDMNAGGRRQSRQPVENASFTYLEDGLYEVSVNNYVRVETDDVGFVIEVENDGKIVQLSHPKAIGNKATEIVAYIHVKNGKIVEIKPAEGIIGGGFTQKKWGIDTETFVKVDTLMHSPNFWDGNAVGNKHWFFILHGCKNDAPTRGIYNEFLNPALEKHRKVFEVLGNKTLCPPAEQQLSGLGFSSTRGDIVTVRAQTDKGQRIFNVNF